MDVKYFLFLLYLLPSIFGAARYDRPHILVFMVDDLGWNDVGYHGAEFETENIDRLANEGLKLKNFYTQPLCSPSRVAFMTGSHPVEKGAQNAVFKHLSVAGLAASEDILPEWLQVYGYNTFLVGKWHLGQSTFDQTPAGQGFDEFFGFFGAYVEHFTHQYGFDMPVYCEDEPFDIRDKWGYDLWENTQGVGQDYEGLYSTELYTEKAEYLIRDHARSVGKSMFLMVTYAAAHDPFQAPLKYINGQACDHIGRDERDVRRVLCGMMQGVDDSIGTIIDVLEDVGYLDNTIILFMSDNGAAGIPGMIVHNGEPAGSNWPLRGSKSTLFEGGVRVPAFIWPHPQTVSAFIPEDLPSETYDLFHISDWFLTILDIAGVSTIQSTQRTLKDTQRDLVASYNQWPSLRTGAASPRTEIFYNLAWPIDREFGAVRNRDFKLHIGTRKTIADGWFNPANKSSEEIICTSGAECSQVLPDKMFWNIRDDPEERRELDTRHLTEWEEENFRQLDSLLEEWKLAVDDLQQENELLDAEGLPVYWNCHWSPWISTQDYPLTFGDSCSDGDGHRKCGRDAAEDDWLKWA